ncbi:MAG: EAL domain-containing protein, partial [Alsobacter sp.]
MIALSVAVTLWAGLGVDWPVAALAGIGTAMTLLAIAALASRPSGEATASHARVAALEEQVAALSGRVSALDNALVEYSRSTVRAVASELDAVGAVVRDLAEAVAAHDAELFAPRTEAEPVAGSGELTRMADPTSRPDPSRPAGSAAVPTVTGASLAATVPPAAANATARPALSRAVVERTADVVLREALEVMLQPVVTLPSRKLRYYDMQLRVAGERVDTGDILGIVEERGLARRFDGFAFGHAVRIARHLAGRGRDVPVLCSLTARALSDPALYQAFADMAASDPGIIGRILLVLPQATLRAMGPADRDGMAGIAALGFRFALDRLVDLNLDPRALHERGVRIVRATVPLMLGAEQGMVPSEIHPADLSGLLARSGLTLIADGIDADGML